MSKTKVFPVVGPGGMTPPNYERGIRALTDEELEHEILVGKGDDGYKHALVAELDRRALLGPPTEPGVKRPSFNADDWSRRP